jgi:hypothetical protein
MGRKGGKFKFADLRGSKAVITARVAEAFSDQWEAQMEHTLVQMWNPPTPWDTNSSAGCMCPRCQICGDPNQMWDANSQEFCTQAVG